MNMRNKATAIRLLDFRSAPMRAFHMTWLAFFLCFFGWFGLAPLMPVIRAGTASHQGADRQLDHRVRGHHRARAAAHRLAVRPRSDRAAPTPGC